MPAMNIEIPHGLGKDAAQTALEGFLDKIRQRYQSQVSDLQESWEGNVLSFSFKTYGFKIAGDLTVNDDSAALSGTLPIAAMAFRGKIEQTIREEIERVLKE